jgi:hypothetical protein
MTAKLTLYYFDKPSTTYEIKGESILYLLENLNIKLAELNHVQELLNCVYANLAFSNLSNPSITIYQRTDTSFYLKLCMGVTLVLHYARHSEEYFIPATTILELLRNLDIKLGDLFTKDKLTFCTNAELNIYERGVKKFSVIIYREGDVIPESYKLSSPPEWSKSNE